MNIFSGLARFQKNVDLIPMDAKIFHMENYWRIYIVCFIGSDSLLNYKWIETRICILMFKTFFLFHFSKKILFSEINTVLYVSDFDTETFIRILNKNFFLDFVWMKIGDSFNNYPKHTQKAVFDLSFNCFLFITVSIGVLIK